MPCISNVLILRDKYPWMNGIIGMEPKDKTPKKAKIMEQEAGPSHTSLAFQEACSVGDYLKKSMNCHRTSLCKTTGFRCKEDYTEAEWDLLSLRVGSSSLTTVYHHHDHFFLRYKYYELKEGYYCCAEFKKHG